jgi:VCBS repeat-containing protein
VLGNDSDANGDALSAVLVAPPSHGTLALAADGSFAYTPDAGYSGTDAFTYQATDGALTGNTATVTITIATTENTRPNAVNDQFTTPAETPLAIDAAGVLANDSDAQSNAMTALLFSGPQHGTVSLASDGSFAYTPSAGYVGIDSFIYRVYDGQKYSALAAVTIRVTAPPVALHAGALDAVAAGHDDDGWLAGTIDDLFGSEEGWM